MSNTFGERFKITTYGESHGHSLGVVIDGCPSGIKIDEDEINLELKRRRPGQSKITTQRKEKDSVTIVSGVFKGYTTGTPIHLQVLNEDQKSKDYSHIEDKYRPNHADYTYQKKYGLRDYRGGGRSSARETIARVAAGVIAKKICHLSEIYVYAFVSSVGNIKLNKHYSDYNLKSCDNNIVRCPDPIIADKMINLINEVRKSQDTIGGIIECVVKGCPVGLGEPVFDKLHARLGYAMLGINAVKGFEYGDGFDVANQYGSNHNDIFTTDENGQLTTKTNHSGGIQGGISNGQDIFFRVPFKPVATILKKQRTVNEHGENVVIEGKGRHDPCVLPRAVPIVEAMTYLVLADMLLINKTTQIKD